VLVDDVERTLTPPRGYDLDATLRFAGLGSLDPTWQRRPGAILKAGRTPDGPVTLLLARERDGVRARAFGPGAHWAIERADALAGLRDDPAAFAPREPPRLRAIARRHRGVHLPRSPWVFEVLTGVILQQRITFRDAARARRILVHRLGAAAPGPGALLLPLAPPDWLRLTSEDFRRAGIDGQRARALRAAARHARRIDAAFDLNPARACEILAAVPGCGPWTVEMTMGLALGDPDAVPIGDLHLPSIVAWALAGELRGDDRRMVELLEPFRGQRFRLLRLLLDDLIDDVDVHREEEIVQQRDRVPAGALGPVHDGEIKQLHAELDEMRVELAAVQERLDFAERLLTREREQAQLWPGADA